MNPSNKPSTPIPAKQGTNNSAKTVQTPQTDTSMAEAKQNRQFMITMIAIMVGIVLVGGYFSYKLLKVYIHKTDEIKAQDRYISALEDKKQALEDLKPNYEEITRKGANNLSTADIVYRALPTRPEYKTLIGVIENIGNANGVVASVSPGTGGSTSTTTATTPSTSTNSTEAGVGSEPVKYEFNVSISSQYDQMIAFLKATEGSLRPLNFKSMNLSGTSGNIVTTIIFTTFYQGRADISDKKEPLK